MSNLPTPQELLYEGKAKRVYRTADPQVYLCQYKDDATAFNAQKRGSIAGKGEVNCTVSSRVFAYLAQQGIRNHFLAQTGPREMQVRALRILPLEVVVRNRAAGSLCKRLGLERGLPIEPPLVEFYYKKRRPGGSPGDSRPHPPVAPGHARASGGVGIPGFGSQHSPSRLLEALPAGAGGL
jgi:phosphoribosylaminoimidazole-succinocarboxamide synthase